MSPTALRLAAIPIALAAFGSRLVLTFVFDPVALRATSPGQSLALMLGGLLAAVAILFTVYGLIVMRGQQRPAHFSVAEGSFVAPSSANTAGAKAIIIMFGAGGLVVTERVPGGDTVRIAEMDFALLVSIVSVAAIAGLAALVLFLDRPRAILTPDALIVKGLWTRTVRWDELAAGGPTWPGSGRFRSLLLYRKPVPGTPAVPIAIPVRQMHIDPAFFAGAIRHFIENPQDRPMIGTEEGLRRLHRAVAIA